MNRKHDLRRLTKRVRRLEDRQRRDMARLKGELIAAIIAANPPPAEPVIRLERQGLVYLVEPERPA